jgi:hypothetical protein
MFISYTIQHQINTVYYCEVINAESPIIGPNRKGNGAWKNGKVFRAPLYFGFQSGNQVSRIGYSHKYVQVLTQNLWHKWAPLKSMRTHFSINYQPETQGGYYYRGTYNPYSLYFK